METVSVVPRSHWQLLGMTDCIRPAGSCGPGHVRNQHEWKCWCRRGVHGCCGRCGAAIPSSPVLVPASVDEDGSATARASGSRRWEGVEAEEKVVDDGRGGVVYVLHTMDIDPEREMVEVDPVRRNNSKGPKTMRELAKDVEEERMSLWARVRWRLLRLGGCRSERRWLAEWE